MTAETKRSSIARRQRRTSPEAARRLQASFPEVWAWYELLVSARGGTNDTPVLGPPCDDPDRPVTRKLA